MINVYIWQNITWLFFHKLSINQYVNKGIHYEIFFNSFKTLIPCGMCRNHYINMLNENHFNLKENIDKKKLFELTIDMHNNVNQRTFKIMWNYKKSRKHYNSIFLDYYMIKRFLLTYIYHNYKKRPDKTQELFKMITSFTHIFPRVNCRTKLINYQKIIKPNINNFEKWITAYLLIIKNELYSN